jgi:hypothetical protein
MEIKNENDAVTDNIRNRGTNENNKGNGVG